MVSARVKQCLWLGLSTFATAGCATANVALVNQVAVHGGAAQACGVTAELDKSTVRAATAESYKKEVDLFEFDGNPGRRGAAHGPNVLRTDSRGACFWAASWVWQKHLDNQPKYTLERVRPALITLITKGLRDDRSGESHPSFVDECALAACQELLEHGGLDQDVAAHAKALIRDAESLKVDIQGCRR